MKLLWTSLCITFGEHKHLFLLDEYPGVKLLSDGVYGCLVLVDTAKQFQNSGASLLSHEPHMRVPGVLHPYQRLALCVFNFLIAFCNENCNEAILESQSFGRLL